MGGLGVTRRVFGNGGQDTMTEEETESVTQVSKKRLLVDDLTDQANMEPADEPLFWWPLLFMQLLAYG